jgi:hypothetical protein
MVHQRVDFLQVLVHLLAPVPYLLVQHGCLKTAFALFHLQELNVCAVHSSVVVPGVLSGLSSSVDLSQAWHEAVVVHFQERLVSDL